MQTLGGRLRELVTYESQNAREKFFRQPRMECYIYSKKKKWKFDFPCQLLVILLTKSLDILCDSSFTEMHLYVTTCTESP